MAGEVALSIPRVFIKPGLEDFHEQVLVLFELLAHRTFVSGGHMPGVDFQGVRDLAVARGGAVGKLALGDLGLFARGELLVADEQLDRAFGDVDADGVTIPNQSDGAACSRFR